MRRLNGAECSGIERSRRASGSPGSAARVEGLSHREGKCIMRSDGGWRSEDRRRSAGGVVFDSMIFHRAGMNASAAPGHAVKPELAPLLGYGMGTVSSVSDRWKRHHRAR
jgi:hypothetical protein